MAKILCSISGVQFSCDFVPISLNSREYHHPIFSLPQKKLLGLYQKYRHNELDPISSYLTFLAYLNSTGLVEFRSPAIYTPQTESIIANNFDSLVSCVERMNRISNPSVQFSRIAVTPDTKNLSNVHYWIGSWESTYEDFTSGYAAFKHSQALHEIESKLEYLIKDSDRNEVQFASRLAAWAEKAGNFPKFHIQVGNSTIPISEYWKQIIRKCTNSESIFSIPSNDLKELLDHCEDNIDAGSIYGYHLFKILREGKEKQSNFLGLGDFQFSILPQDTSVESANKLAIIQNAPDKEPSRLDYPSQFQYLKAKLAWDMKVSHKEEETKEEAKRKEIAEELNQEGESE